MQKKRLDLTIFLTLGIVFLEVIFKVLSGSQLWQISFLSAVCFWLAASFLISFFASLFSRKINYLLVLTVFFLLFLLFSTEIIFFKVFDVYFSVADFGLADQAADFWRDTIALILKYSYALVIFLIPFISTILFRKQIGFERASANNLLSKILLLLIFIVLFQVSLLIKKENSFSGYQLYYKVNNNYLTTAKIGVIPARFLEIKRAIFGFEEAKAALKVAPKAKKEPTKEKSVIYNITDIDFTALAASENNGVLKNMHTYFASDTGTKQNEYTGYYKGKNLIVFMAESFNSIAVSQELTPTLYKLTNESFVFNNFYTPVMLSTLGGEFQELTGIYPSSLSSIWRKGTNYFPYGFGTQYAAQGYKTFAYHNNQYNFQSRDVYLKNLGFTNYLGCFNGLEKKINCYQWPESDIEMIEATTPDYISADEPFMVYYATVSGHMSYSWYNQMAKKHKAAVQDLAVSEEAKAYVATQIELDQALALLIEKLTAAGKLDDTVIALVGDHYPYAMDLATINELSSYERDAIIEINRSNFILWNSKTPKTQITKVGCQVDVLPTLLNLYGIKYDSRLIIGKDILSDEPGLAIFNNQSWVSDYGKYNSLTGTFTPNKDVVIPDNYVTDMNSVVASKITMGKLILEKNYYQRVMGG